MSFGDLSVREFNATLAEGSPTPGGGAAAALTGATAAALVEMVCNVTLGDDDIAADLETDLTRRLDALADRREELTELADADAAAFEAVMEAYRRSSDDPDRSAAIQSAMIGAAEVPLETATACLAVVEHAAELTETGNQNAVTDAAAAALLGRAALETALYNVDINLASIDDPSRVEDLADRRQTIAADADAAVARVEAHLATAI